MSEAATKTAENKPEATAATAQNQAIPAPSIQPAPAAVADGAEFVIGDGILRAPVEAPYQRQPHDPLYRPLRIFTLDPSLSALQGSVATVKVPYEPLKPGPVGKIFEVDGFDGMQTNQRVDLDDDRLLMENGLNPSPSDPRFHQQMVYAVCSSVYAAFRTALGRDLGWGFCNHDGRLRIRPYAKDAGKNAFYDREAGELRFGYYKASERPFGRNLPDSWVFTSLSHDIVVHELTHALLDGMRAHFTIPTRPDVLAFHEAFADMVALFQHFTYERVVQTSIQEARGDLKAAGLLTDLARQFKHTADDSGGDGRPLRSPVEVREFDSDGRPKPPRQYAGASKPHDLGIVLVSAVFEAFSKVFERKALRYIRLATNGSGILAPGELSPHLVSILAAEASKLAGQFLSICIRAIDYCPPVDISFGEYLRALITADYALVPDDPWCYREALVDAFGARGIYPSDVSNLSEDALMWRPFRRDLPAIEDLNFANLRFRGDPSIPAGRDELYRQACVLGRYVTHPDRAHLFGLGRVSGLDPAKVQSIRSTRRVGPAGQVVFDLVAEVTQRRLLRDADGRSFYFYGGSTIILDPTGKIRVVIRKDVASARRQRRTMEYLKSEEASALWEERDGKLFPRREMFRLLHGEA